MKKVYNSIITMFLFITLTILSLDLITFQNVSRFIAYADDYEYAWFPVDQVNLTQLSFESYSHSYSYHIDCKGGNYAFAPFTGKVVYIDTSWGMLGLQSTNKVHWADGSLDYMTVWFMHGLNSGSYTKGQIINQGTSFYKMGGMGDGNPNCYGYHYDIGVSRGQINTPKDQSGHGVGNYCGCGSDYPYNAFFLNRQKTPNIVNPGKLRGSFVGGSNNKSNWTGLWKDLGDIPNSNPYMKITNQTYPEGTLTPGKSCAINGIISAYPNIEAVWGGVAYRDGGGYVDGFYYQEFPNTSSYDLSKTFDNKLIFNNLPVGYYTYYIYGRDTSKKEYELIKSDFQVGEPIKEPTISELSASSYVINTGQSITFTAKSDTATGYTIGIDKDGVRKITEEMPNGELTKLFTETGTYSAYVTSYNSAGYCDSSRITFTVSVPTITVTLNPNGGKCSKSSIVVNKGGTYSGLVDATDKTGYTFAGWFTQDEKQVRNGDKLAFDTIHTLYAHWKPNEYILTVNPNGGTYDNSTSAVAKSPKLIYNAGNWWTIGKATRTEYVLTGYFSEASGGAKIYDANGEALNSTFWKDKKYINAGNLNVYAQWTPNKYTVNLNANGGTVDSTSVIVTYDSRYNLPDVSQTGYHFNGWFTAAEGGTQIVANDTVKITADQTLYAHWSKDTMMITFDTKGGTSEAGTKFVKYDNKYGVLPNAERTGYEFEGWYLDENCTNQITSDSVVKITANQSVYAKWTLRKYTVKFDANGGTVQTASKQVTYGKNYGVLPVATKENDVFIGWFTEDGTEITSDSIVELVDDTVIYAKWQSESTVAGDINLDGKADTQDIIFLQAYLHGREQFTVDNFYAADVLEDGQVNIFDLVILKQMLLERNGG
ncbi:MAG: InlB B-repeat-containing protein [Oscillospiraceae bacterium]|nr:InlB B-repeat-containing protein [Oscillospiraceae bacterium]